MKTTHFIYPGRFQPFHNDHLNIVNNFFHQFSKNMLILGIVTQVNYILDKKSDFYKKSLENFELDRNPFSPMQVLAMVNALASKRFPGKALPTFLPQPGEGLSWEIVKCFFPGRRVWLIPRRNESWDEIKSSFFNKMGDEVLRIDSPRTVSGQSIRKLMLEDRASIREIVPPEISSIIESLS
jgi:nicotinamide mononucleotide adenylyltransferase